MIRASTAPILWNSTAASPETAVGAVFVFCDSRKARSRSGVGVAPGEYRNEERECRRFNS
jgi:hypothetical protein